MHDLGLGMSRQLCITQLSLRRTPSRHHHRSSLRSRQYIQRRPLHRTIHTSKRRIRRRTYNSRNRNTHVTKSSLQSRHNIRIMRGLIGRRLSNLRQLNTRRRPPRASRIRHRRSTNHTTPPIRPITHNLNTQRSHRPRLIRHRHHTIRHTPRSRTSNNTIPRSTRRRHSRRITMNTRFTFTITTRQGMRMITRPYKRQSVPPPPRFNSNNQLMKNIRILKRPRSRRRNSTSNRIQVT